MATISLYILLFFAYYQGLVRAVDANASFDTHLNSPPPQRLKVFLMVGQSNTQGHGYINTTDEVGNYRNGTLEWLVQERPEFFGKLKQRGRRSRRSRWTPRRDVWIAYNRQFAGAVRPEIGQHGHLVPGYGGDPGQEGLQMGPELSFGWTMGDAFNGNVGKHHHHQTKQQILILKIAWGGRSLAVDYRPPSSGGTTGLYYESMLAHTWRALGQLDKFFSQYNTLPGYELAGFVWHQGWNDGCDEEMTAEYEQNLANLIRDVRTDLGVPQLPVSIGVSGFHGYTPDVRRDAIIAAQFAVANATRYPEFAGNVVSMDTRSFARPPIPNSPGRQVYHWNNNCETYWLVGQAMADGMLSILESTMTNKTRISSITTVL